MLEFAGGCRALANHSGGLAFCRLLDAAALQVQNEIESVVQWAGCLQLVVADLARATRTVTLVGTEVATGARVGRGDQDEARRVLDAHLDARNVNDAGLHRLPKHVERLPWELPKFVEE